MQPCGTVKYFWLLSRQLMIRNSMQSLFKWFSSFLKSYVNWQYSIVAQMVKSPSAMQETWVQSLGREDPLEEDKAIHSSILACRIPWTEKPGGLQSTGSQRVRHDWVTNTFKPHGHCCSCLCVWLPLRSQPSGFYTPAPPAILAALSAPVVPKKHPQNPECLQRSKSSEQSSGAWLTVTGWSFWAVLLSQAGPKINRCD